VQKDHPVFTPPNNEYATIWRFLDFTKFVSLLDRKSSYFCRADLIGDDPFEGAYSNYTLENIRNYWIVDEDWSMMELAHVMDMAKNFPKFHYLNCWHVNDVESAAMWKLYTKDSNQTIVIKSTYKKLCQSFHKARFPIYIGLVNYIDYDTEEIPTDDPLRPYVYKRKSFEHERELRAVISNLPHNPWRDESQFGEPGLYIPTNLEYLIDKIYVAPASPPWFKDLVTALMEKYEIDKPIESSRLDERPMY